MPVCWSIKKCEDKMESGKKQDISKRVAGKFKWHEEADLRIKYVREPRQKSREAAYMQCLTKKNGYRPLLNKRKGDGSSRRKRSSLCQSL